MRIIQTLAIVLLTTARVMAGTSIVARGELVASFEMRFVGGYMFVSIPVEDTSGVQGAPAAMRDFLLDAAVSNDGNFLYDEDSRYIVTQMYPYRFPVSTSRTLTVSLVPTQAGSQFAKLNPNYMGTLGYQFLKRYVTVFDFASRRVNLYSTQTPIEYDTTAARTAIRAGLADDAEITFCRCQYPSFWIEVTAPPLKKGRVHLALAEANSAIYREALDDKTLALIDGELRKDTVSGKKEFGGVEMATYIIDGHNIADRNPKRIVVNRPQKFRDLNITVVGTLAVDVFRRYRAVSLDPIRSELLLIP